MIAAEEFDIFYRAMVSRDSRFDGRFFAGVTSTGVYCRPICPAPKPKQENVRFYLTAAGAENEGFRPCKRCRPDAAPGTLAWSRTSTIISRALQLIGEGFLDGNGVGDLGDRLGLGERQLRRLFTSHLGASPHAVALTRRLDFARKLIDETNLNMTDIAFASGFESIRRFNDAVKKRFEESPSYLRKTAHCNSKKERTLNYLILQLPYRPPLDWPWLINYLETRQIPGVEIVNDECYSRSFQIIPRGHSIAMVGFFKVTPSKKANHLEFTIFFNEPSQLMSIVYRVRRIFDLDADPLSIASHLEKDPCLLPLTRMFPGLRVPGSWDNFEIAVRAIIGQQVTIRAANTITLRLLERCGCSVKDSPLPGITHLFPGPSAIANANLDGLGMPGKRIETLKTLGAKVACGDIVLEGTINWEMMKKKLREINGIGEWSTEYIAMRALRDPDAFPATDLALKRELTILLNDNKNEDEPRKTDRPNIWKPWRAYAAVYLWKKYGQRKGATK